jgi:hypothetical protein
MLELERASSEELEALGRLGVFPSSEVAAVKKRFKFLKEQQDLGKASDDVDFPLYLEDLELRVTENKLGLLRACRLQEEESRAAYRKKLAKIKHLEETQSRDPANFRNQRRF